MDEQSTETPLGEPMESVSERFEKLDLQTEENFDEKFVFPLSAPEEIENFDKELEANEKYKDFMKKKLRYMDDGEIYAKWLIGKLFKQDALAKFNWGRQSTDKQLFRDFEHTINFLYDLISTVDSKWTEDRNKTFLQNTLKNMKSKQSHEKCEAKKKQCTTKKQNKVDEEKGFNFDNPNDPGLDPDIQSSHCDLCKAALEGNLPEVQTLFSEKKDVEMDQTALHCASLKGHLEIVEYLAKESGKNYIEKTNEQNFTALTIAIWYGHQEIVKFLTEKGANINRTGVLYPDTQWGDWLFTVLNTACWRGHTSIVDFLLKKGVNIENPTTFKGYTPLMTACHRKHLETTALLLKYGANVNAITRRSDKKDIWTALYAAIEARCLYIVQLLVENGTNLEKFGEDAIIYATNLQYNEIVKYLEKKLKCHNLEKSSLE